MEVIRQSVPQTGRNGSWPRPRIGAAQNHGSPTGLINYVWSFEKEFDMYGTIARYRVKPGMMPELLDYEATIKALGMPGFVAEFTLNTVDDPEICYELIIFESREAYEAVARMPGREERYQGLLDLLNGPPEWHRGVLIHANPELRVTAHQGSAGL